MLPRNPRFWLVPLLVTALPLIPFAAACSGEAPAEPEEAPGNPPLFARAPVEPPEPSSDDPAEDTPPNPWLDGIPGEEPSTPDDDPTESSGGAANDDPASKEPDPESPPPPPEPAHLLLTQMYEGLGNDKALELTNLGAQSVDLARCALSTYVNGNTEPYRNATLGGTLEPGASVVFCAASASATLMARCADTSSAIAFNGNDAVLLRCDGELVDAFGRLGEDPGTAWGTSVRTMDANLVRLCDAQPRLVPDAPFEPADQWRSVLLDDLDELGSWICDGAPDGDPADLPEGHQPLEPLPAELCNPDELLSVPE